MRRFRDLPIGQKLVVVAVAASVLALFVSSVAVGSAAFVALRKDVRGDLQAQAQIIATNSSAAVAFQDVRTANQIIGALHSNADIEMACLYDGTGKPFTSYQREDGQCPGTAPPDGTLIGRQVTVSLPVAETELRVGTLYVEGNLSQVRSRLMAQIVASVFGIVLGVIAAMLLSARIQRLIARPIEDLSSVAARISRGGDYSLRAAKHGDDEVGQLVDTFNTMVAEIERRDDQLRSASRLKDEFLAALSHELRTPLNAVLGWVQVLRAAPADANTQTRAYESIERNARAQASLIEDLLDISRIVTGKLSFKSEPVDLVPIIDAACEVVRPAADAKNISMTRHLMPSPQWVAGDPNRLQQIAWNLLSNAVKFSNMGGHVDVSLHADAQQYFFEVRDDGMGISAEFLPHVFDRFRQADGSMTRRHGGLGLGLAIARDLAELHGGSVMADSGGLGKGSTFTVVIPRQGAHHPAPREATSSHANALAGMSVLVVDDDEDTRDVLREAVRAAGGAVDTAGSGDAALRSLRDRPVDLILCDLAMPGMDGYELMRRIRAAGPRGNGPAAVAVSAHAGTLAEARAREVGFQAFVAKPYSTDALFEAIAEARKAHIKA